MKQVCAQIARDRSCDSITTEECVRSAGEPICMSSLSANAAYKSYETGPLVMRTEQMERVMDSSALN